MALMLYRYAKGLDTAKKAGTFSNFSGGDKPSSRAADTIALATGGYLISGKSGGMPDPTGNAT